MPSPKHFLQTVSFILVLFLLAAQCHSPPPPPLPATPTGPVVRIALLSPASGEMATFGRFMRNGVIMAFDKWNEQGGALDHQIEWTNYDTHCRFEPARQAAQQAIVEGHQLIIGPLCSTAAIAAATAVESEQALMISPTATHPLVTVDGRGQTRPMVFRISYVWPWQARAAAQFARDNLKANQAALLFPAGDDYAVALAETFSQQFAAHGGKIVYQGRYTPGHTDLAGVLTAIGQSQAEIIYLPADAALVNQVAGQLKESGLAEAPTKIPTALTLLGSDSWESPELDLSVAAGSYFTAHFAAAENRPLVKTWTNAYKATYAIEPDTLAALGYDAANVLITAIEQAGTFEPAAIAQALEQGKFTGVTGQMSFDAQHNPLKPAPILYIDRQSLVFFTSIVPRQE
ncbi:MAG: ABC transporter substrate-binding protein [Anaerolineae bacterium]|nr:ABC transporter substrate-binding protein [Anaerolineae bacterium]